MKFGELQPKDLWHYFEEICKIPHGSGNTKQISDAGDRKGLGMLVKTNCFCTFARKLTDGSYVIYLPHAQNSKL